MARTIVKTTTVGWFIDAADPDGPRVRKKPDDTIITLDEFQAQQSGDGSTPTQKRAVNAAKATRNKPQQADAEKATSVPITTSESGKVLRGKTTVIKCTYKGEDGESGPVCGKEREIKVQDAFQVKYCVTHQTAHRRKIKREKLRAKRKEAKAAAGK